MSTTPSSSPEGPIVDAVNDDGTDTGVIVGVTIGVVMLIVIVVVIAFIFYNKTHERNHSYSPAKEMAKTGTTVIPGPAALSGERGEANNTQPEGERLI